jgi:hypothetical protein
MGHMSEDARALIRAAQEVHAERHGPQTFLPGTRLSFLDVAKRTGIRSDGQCYYECARVRDTLGGTSTTSSPSVA